MLQVEFRKTNYRDKRTNTRRTKIHQENQEKNRKKKKIILQVTKSDPGPTSATNHSAMVVKHTSRVKLKLESLVGAT